MTAERLNEIQKSYLDALAGMSEQRAHTTDKLPLNFWHLGFLQMLVPGARVIHCVRDALDTCVSCYVQPLGGGHEYRLKLDTLGRYYRTYRRLMDHWKRVLKLPILDVVYEEMVANLEPQCRRLVQFTGLTWNDACLRYYESKRTTRTASREQVRQPIYRTSVGRADRFAAHLQPLQAALGEFSRVLGA